MVIDVSYQIGCRIWFGVQGPRSRKLHARTKQLCPTSSVMAGKFKASPLIASDALEILKHVEEVKCLLQAGSLRDLEDRGPAVPSLTLMSPGHVSLFLVWGEDGQYICRN